MPSDPDGFPPAPPALNPDQQKSLSEAKAWWQEGERSLDYLAELAQQRVRLTEIRQLAERLRTESEPTATLVAPLLRAVRQATGNRLMNRTRETDRFAVALRDLLWGTTELPRRIEAFLQEPSVSALTVTQWLHSVFPERYPPVRPETRSVIAPTRAQITRAREFAAETHRPVTLSPMVRDLLGDFALYDAARRFLGLNDFLELHAILIRSGERPRTDRRQSVIVREIANGTYGNEPQGAEGAPERATESDLVAVLEQEVSARGFTFPERTLRSYYVSLKAKPFVLLAGLSGTGKTRLTRLFADFLTGAASDRYLLVPVRPDWHDSAGLLGFHNLLSDRYVSTPFLDLLRTAGQPENRDRAFFVCLDEMNLARTEHYFAEVLSAMETDDGVIPLQEGRSVRLPVNVFLTGSINQDEATHTLSRKVLDRANTLEFVRVDLDRRPKTVPMSVREISYPERQALFFGGLVRTVAAAEERLSAPNSSYGDRIVDTLSELNGWLTPRGQQFGYRVRDEILRFVAASISIERTGLLVPEPEANLTAALDLQILQKVLPRISGTTEALAGLLATIEGWATERSFTETAEKAARMRHRATEDGFVSFFEV
ncbi:MAG: hypothetical protein SFU56_20930 [Capsulimonadales bacterium]|nr:hypothetical protein [Capsulimonadales bacterium]